MQSQLTEKRKKPAFKMFLQYAREDALGRMRCATTKTVASIINYIEGKITECWLVEGMFS